MKRNMMTNVSVTKLQKLLVVAVTSVLIGLFAGCAKYKSASLTKPIGEAVEKNNVSASAHLLSDADCYHCFSRNVGKHGYRAVQLHVKNESAHDVVLDASTINMPIENRDHVASRLHLDMTPRVVGWGVAGLFLWPFLIPAVVEAIETPKANKKLDQDFESRVLDINSKTTIKSYAALNMVFFVRKENVSDMLHFGLKDVKTKAVTSLSVNIA